MVTQTNFPALCSNTSGCILAPPLLRSDFGLVRSHNGVSALLLDLVREVQRADILHCHHKALLRLLLQRRLLRVERSLQLCVLLEVQILRVSQLPLAFVLLSLLLRKLFLLLCALRLQLRRQRIARRDDLGDLMLDLRDLLVDADDLPADVAIRLRQLQVDEQKETRRR
jgi:hypothetical protein